MTTDTVTTDAATSIAATTTSEPVTGAPAPGATPQGAAEPQRGSPEASTEAYGAFTLPEGWEIAPADLTAFQEIAKGINLDQEQAQKMVDLFVTIEGNRGEFLKGLEEKQVADRNAAWKTELQNDPEIGGDKFPAAQANIAMLEQAGVLIPEFKAWLIESGEYGRPVIIKQLAKLGASMKEDPIMFGNATGRGDGQTPAQRMFAKSGHV